jgi:glycosyl hydrolase family 99
LRLWIYPIQCYTSPRSMTKRASLLSLAAFFVAFLFNFSLPSPSSARPQPLVLAFYYAWFDQNIWDLTKVADLPTLKYLSNDPSTIDRQIQMAQVAGIDVFVVSWWGAGNPTDVNFRTMLDVSAARNFKTAADFEITSPFYHNRDDIVNSLRNLLATYTNHPGYLRVDGKPVIFFWRDKGASIARGLNFSVDEWADIRKQVDPNHSSLWIHEGIDYEYLRVFDGLHLYSIAWSPNVFGEDAKWPRRVKAFGYDKLWIATVMPGNDDRKTHRPDSYLRDRENGAFYRQTWQAAFATNPDWIIITSWNEWVEGTMIEPSVTYGNLYLDITRQYAAQFKKGLPSPTPTLSPTPKPTASATLPPPTRVATPTRAATPTNAVLPPPAAPPPAAASPEPTDDSTPVIHASLNTNPVGVHATTTNAMRVLSEPNLASSIVGVLRQGLDIPLFARTVDGKWFQTQFPNSTQRGWVTAEFLQVSGSTDALLVLQGSTFVAPLPTETPLAEAPEQAPQEDPATPVPAPTRTLTPPRTFKPPFHLPFFP